MRSKSNCWLWVCLYVACTLYLQHCGTKYGQSACPCLPFRVGDLKQKKRGKTPLMNTKGSTTVYIPFLWLHIIYFSAAWSVSYNCTKGVLLSFDACMKANSNLYSDYLDTRIFDCLLYCNFTGFAIIKKLRLFLRLFIFQMWTILIIMLVFSHFIVSGYISSIHLVP